MEQTDYQQLLYQSLVSIWEEQAWSNYQKNKTLFETFVLILEEATADDRIHFTTLFSRLAYVGAKYQLSGSVLHYCHVFRKGHERGEIKSNNEADFVDLGFFVCYTLMHIMWRFDRPTYIADLENVVIQSFKKDKMKTIGFRSVVEAVIFEVDKDKKQLLFYDEADPDTQKIALYDVCDKNEIFNGNVESIIKTFELPTQINFIDVEIRDDGVYIPSAWIIHPDYLVDVTAISECFKDFGTEPFLYLISKFKPSQVSSAIFIGNLVNKLLDELVTSPEINFNEILPVLFSVQPLSWALMDDVEVRDAVSNLKVHFKNLQYAVKNEFDRFNIKRENIFLEPSFYSRDYGIQGRLDLLQQKSGQLVFDIVELKSGKTFKPNVYGINASHYIQTLLYDLMIRSVFRTQSKSFNYILYSRESDKPIRFAPPVKAKQYEAMKLRNDLMAIEQRLRNTHEDNILLQYIKPENFTKLKGFSLRDIENFYNVYSTLHELDKLFFEYFTAFVAREQLLAKTGTHGFNKSHGHAALWLESDEEKKERFELLAGLRIIANHSIEIEPFITLTRDPDDFTLVNFRSGDIAVLYPQIQGQFQPVLKNQIFKCTITKISNEIVQIKLRNRQYNQSLFSEHTYWRLEADSLDSSFNQMYQSLFTWAAAPFEYRRLYMGLSIPRVSNTDKEVYIDQAEMTDHQASLLQKMISTKDYFLLWGPPGTGKTSVILKNLVKHLNQKTNESILLLAYTNRAVDEICEAVESIDGSYSNKYIRIGSRLATDGRYVPQLLEQKVKNLKSRQEILNLLKDNRIYIATIASIISKPELFHLKEFDTVIIDEASQILEPMLSGLLSRVRRWMMIGDHKQLPAIVTQDAEDSKIKNSKLIDVGFVDTRTSLFERLFHQVKQRGWIHAYGILHQQGRMHHELMYYPNQNYYEGQLEVLPNTQRLLDTKFFKKTSEVTAYLTKRKIYFNTAEDHYLNWKTNIHEAQKCVDIIKDLVLLYEINQKSILPDSIGIITLYRAQIALIKKCLGVIPEKYTKMITIDTIERYQGGARDIIIISFCVNKINQLDTLISLSQEGIDRKLNVALTRAKEQIILIGNEKLLSNSPEYRNLIKYFKTENT